MLAAYVRNKEALICELFLITKGPFITWFVLQYKAFELNPSILSVLIIITLLSLLLVVVFSSLKVTLAIVLYTLFLCY